MHLLSIQERESRSSISDGANYIVCCFDISSRESFENCSKWIQSVMSAGTDAQVLIVANKADLRNGTARAEVDADEGKRFTNSKG